MITAHDGFTLADLVSYDSKHNEANGEANRDGTDDNRSWNCGVEGPTTDGEILALRGRQSRALLATLLLSFGIPMIVGGDELGRTQQGNNNAYCQDNPITWFDWSAVDEDLLAFTRQLVAFRQTHPVFRRRRFLVGAEAGELLWFTPAGTPVTAAEWRDPDARSLALYLDGADAPDLAADGSPMIDDDFLLLVNAWWEPLEGPTTDREILALRGRQSRALLATLLLSFGIPMIVGGDELGRTQQGNNNAYCQDNPITWFDWSAVDKDLLAFTRRLVALRQAHPVFRRRRFLIGAEAAELLWFTPAGTPMTEAEWRDPDARSLALYLDGADAPDLAADGSPMLDDDFLLLVNAWWEPLDFTIPPTRPGQTWLREIDTFDPTGTESSATAGAADQVAVGPRSVVVLRAPATP